MNKVAFISGSAKRLGAHTATHLHSLGYQVVLHCHQSAQQAAELLDCLNNRRPASAALVRGDLSNTSNLSSMAADIIKQFGRLDVLVNNASSFYPTPLSSIHLEQWRELVGSNLQAPLFLCHFLADELRRRKGTIINMVDIHAFRPLVGHSLYCLAKAGLVSMTRSLAIELAPDVRVNAVAPGAILWPEQDMETKQKQEILAQIPLARLGESQDIANAIEYLLQAKYVTGQVLTVDGGRSLTGA
ncbi:pteridine reductase [Bowmanella denitrificans]|uniref:pteridine reductase n=1 Tax=Bowmanella denitrificans TaxID=366582 RepID=UPI000C99B349|nr:pteridine reductase [Bowmanella denitrificans]